jgi:hypothetical protein
VCANLICEDNVQRVLDGNAQIPFKLMLIYKDIMEVKFLPWTTTLLYVFQCGMPPQVIDHITELILLSRVGFLMIAEDPRTFFLRVRRLMDTYPRLYDAHAGAHHITYVGRTVIHMKGAKSNNRTGYFYSRDMVKIGGARHFERPVDDDEDTHFKPWQGPAWAAQRIQRQASELYAPSDLTRQCRSAPARPFSFSGT